MAQQMRLQSAGTATSEPQVEAQVSEQVAEQPQQLSQPSQDSTSHPAQTPPLPQSRPTPQPHPEHQSQPQPHPQPQAGNLFNFISNIIGNMRGATPGMGMGSFSFQIPTPQTQPPPPPPMHPPPPPRPTNLQSASADTALAAGTDPANQTSGFPFLSMMNMMTGQGTSRVRFCAHYFGGKVDDWIKNCVLSYPCYIPLRDEQ